jgi:predicted metalloprotease with PDZ domain
MKFTRTVGRLFTLVAFTLTLPAIARAGATITLSVDATAAARKTIHTHEVLAVSPGALTLLYPKWIPGEHGPTGPLMGVAGLKIMSGTQVIAWQRDLDEMYSIHCNVPAGANALTIDFDMVTAQENTGFSAGASSSAQLCVLNWNQHVLYPAGIPADQITVTATLRIPDGWHAATALPTAVPGATSIQFSPVSLFTLVDSPVQMGAYTKSVALNPGDAKPVTLHLAADSRAALEMTPEQTQRLKNLVAEAHALFGARHYNSYHFLWTLSDHVAAFGLEHHESSDDRDPERSLIDPDLYLGDATLLTHEYSHSWNGKYRRPADLTTPDFQKPMETDLLWVYEGLTQYLGALLAARAGLYTPEQYRSYLAIRVAQLETERGRSWRPLVDTATEAQLLYFAPIEGQAWRRGTDFYDEGTLIWLEADAKIRALTAGRKSLDDFCRAFHGGADSAPKVVTYTFDDVVDALNQIAPFDWATFLRDRVEKVNPHAPVGGIEADGWRLAWRDSSSDVYKASEVVDKRIQLMYSIGLTVSDDESGGKAGMIVDVVPGGVADRAGIAPGMELVAVNGREWNKDVLREAVRATAHGEPLELLVKNAEYFRSCKLDYKGGERYPWLERIPGRPDVLSELIKPRAAK